MIIQELQRIQKAWGFLPRSELQSLAERLHTPLYRVHEVASFFPQFRRDPPPEVEVRVCRDMSCRLRGSTDVLRQLESLAAEFRSRLSVRGVSCVGRCDRPPVLTVACHRQAEAGRSHLYTRRAPAEACALLRQILAGSIPPPDTDAAWTDHSRSWEIDVYKGMPTYGAVRLFVEALGREPTREAGHRGIITALEEAGLLGMGGAGGRTYKKWNDVYTATSDEKYVVCNGDESEPGTFKDREILLRTPFLVLEGMIIAGLLLGAKRGYVYIRHEYHEQIESVKRAIRVAEEANVCGQRILGTELSFPIEVFVSPGGYICGEQTALLEVLEDKRAEPRNRPPEPQTNGLWDRPTLVNNVETFAWVPAILLRGRRVAEREGRGFRGLRLLSVSGDVASPGVYEVPNGMTLRDLVARAGGMRDGQTFKAVAPSGPSGGFLPRFLPLEALPRRFVDARALHDRAHFDILDWELDLLVAREMGLMLGAGIIVFGDRAEMVEQALGSLEFFRNESCGKCAPCRIGTQKLVESCLRILKGQLGATEEATLAELGASMKATSLCGLGTVAANPVRTLLRYFQADVQTHVGGAGCPRTPAAGS